MCLCPIIDCNQQFEFLLFSFLFLLLKYCALAHHNTCFMSSTEFQVYEFQCEGKAYNDKSDIWAMGCILYEMACLQKTFEGSNLPALVNKIMKVMMI